MARWLSDLLDNREKFFPESNWLGRQPMQRESFSWSLLVNQPVPILWIKIGLPPALLIAALFGGRLLEEMPALNAEIQAKSVKPTVLQRHRYIADHLYGIDFFDDKHGISTGYYGTVLRTRDGGQNWSWHSTGETQLLRRVHMTSADQAVSIGHRGAIYRTEKGGSHWQVVHREPDTMLRAVALAEDGSTGWAVGSGAAILRTEDSGRNWLRQVLTGYTPRDLPTWNGVAIVDADPVALAGEFGMLAFSSDGGESWIVKESPTRTTLNDIVVMPGGYLAVGLDGTAVTIAQQGDDYTLRALSTGSIEHLFALSVDADGKGVAVGSRTLLAVSPDGFAAISVSDSVELPYNWFADIDMTRSGAVWSVGRRGLVAGAPAGGGAFEVLFRLGIDTPSNAATSLAESES